MVNHLDDTLSEKCPYSELFWSSFFHTRTEYGVSLRIQNKCGKMRTKITTNTDTIHASITFVIEYMIKETNKT